MSNRILYAAIFMTIFVCVPIRVPYSAVERFNYELFFVLVYVIEILYLDDNNNYYDVHG